MPIFFNVRSILAAIAPLLAIKTLVNILKPPFLKDYLPPYLFDGRDVLFFGVPYKKPYGSRVVIVAGIVELGAVAYEDHSVLKRLHLNIFSRI